MNVYSTGTIDNQNSSAKVGGVIAWTGTGNTTSLAQSYFVRGSSGLPPNGFSTTDPLASDSVNRTLENTSWSAILSAFNVSTEGNNSWKAGPNGRPVMIALPAE